MDFFDSNICLCGKTYILRFCIYDDKDLKENISVFKILCIIDSLKDKFMKYFLTKVKENFKSTEGFGNSKQLQWKIVLKKFW